jgi:hypothetical protein
VADAARYLLPTERAEVTIRRHWAVLAGATAQSVLLLTIGVLLARVLGSIDFAQMVLVYFCIFVVARWIWAVIDWQHEVLIVTDKRLLLVTGIFSRNLAIMPLVKVTDLTFHRSASGLTFGYGKFIVESAGQDQALSTIDFVPQPEKLYIQISELLFGGDKGSPGAMVTEAQREAEAEEERARRRRWRKYTRRGPDEPVDDRPAAAASSSHLDAIIADRDTLLVDRNDPDRPQDGREWDRSGPYTELRDADFGDYGDDADDAGPDDLPPPADRPGRLPRIHEPRRGERTEAIEPTSPLPPPRRPREDRPPGFDPLDD